MPITQEKLDQLLVLLRSRPEYSDWRGFDHPRFRHDERDYKIATLRKAQDLLSRDELRSLIDTKQYDEIIDRLDKVGKDNNLLWRGVPRSGDLGILYAEDLDRPAFCQAMNDLLYGGGSTSERLHAYTKFVKAAGLPNKWTFPTYFLFFCHPESEIFVKPSTMKWFLGFTAGSTTGSAAGPTAFPSEPTVPIYNQIRSAAHELRDMLASQHPEDLIDIQSLIWVCARAATTRNELIRGSQQTEFENLFDEFASEYLSAAPGREHVAIVSRVRAEARSNYQTVRAAKRKGEDITDQVLRLFLPHSDTSHLRAQGAWIHNAPAVTHDVKQWYESGNLTKPEDWPAVAEAIYTFVVNCLEHPENLAHHCEGFSSTVPSKGFQSGMLTPILNALAPDQFCLVNSKPLKTTNYFANQKFTANLRDYANLNSTMLALIQQNEDLLTARMPEHTTAADVYDYFSHWLVAIKKFAFKDSRYYKISPGEAAWHWDACKEGGFIAIGWDALGDVSELSKAEFEARRAELKSRKGYTKSGVNQVWRFAHIEEGDQIIANKGTTELLGIGTVTGPYYFVEGVRHGHRLPVDWHDLARRRIDEGGWRRSVIRLTPEKFNELAAAPVIPPSTSTLLAQETFDRLRGLEAEPTKEFYKRHHNSIRTYVEDPFKELMRDISKRLPDEMRAALETRKGILARIPKNDYGRGGAYPYLWGAFYPKGSKRIADMQLCVGLHPDRLEFGFALGDYAQERKVRFLKNLNTHGVSLAELLKSSVANGDYAFGYDPNDESSSSGGALTHDAIAWLADPAKFGLRVTRAIPAEQALTRTKTELATTIAATLHNLFPFVLVGVSDKPVESVRRHLGVSHIVDPPIQPVYTLEDCAKATSFDPTTLERWVRAIQRKGQAVVYGPPGTGKTYVAQHIARHLIGGGRGFGELVQFHPEYAYQDFVQGIRPRTNADGKLQYELRPGRFVSFCERATQAKDTCVLIIDEINRANLAQVFGELMYLLEYRDASIPLSGGGTFSIPRNVRLIGTMNTADRSIALVDYALRRRFAFLGLRPDFAVLRNYHREHETGYPIEQLIEVLRRVNQQIDDPNFEVGISFFLTKRLAEDIADIWTMEIHPYLEEYFFDQPQRAHELSWSNVSMSLSP